MSFKKYPRLVYTNKEDYLPEKFHYWSYIYGVDNIIFNSNLKGIDCRACFYEI